MVDHFFVKRGNRVVGPYSRSALVKALSDARLCEADFVARSRIGPWRMISEALAADEDKPQELEDFDALLHEMIGARNNPKPPSNAAATPVVTFDPSVLKDTLSQIVTTLTSAAYLKWAVMVGIFGIATMGGVVAFGPRASLLGIALFIILVSTIVHATAMRIISENLILFFLVMILGYSINGIPAYLWVLNGLLMHGSSATPLVPEAFFWYAALWQLGVGYYTTTQLVVKDEVPIGWCVFYYLAFQCFGLALVAIVRPSLIRQLLLWLAQGR